MTDWLEGWPRDESIEGAGGGTYTGNFPWRFVLHTTEGSWDSAMSVFRSRMVSPHLMYDPATRRKVQFIDLDRSAYALRHTGVETNRAHCIQVEIIGFAANPPAGELADRIGEDVIAAVLKSKPITTGHPTFYGEGAGFVVASESARQRMSAAAWSSFNGICGHQHVPDNSHWDPGGFDIERAIAAAGAQGDLTIMDTDTKNYLDVHFLTQAIVTKRESLANLKATWKTRAELRDAGVLPKKGETDSELQTSIAELEAAVKEDEDRLAELRKAS